MNPDESKITGGLAAEIGDEAPEWIELIPAGTFTLADGRGTFHLKDPAKVIAQSFEGDTKIAIDVDHGIDERRDGSAAGWITKMEVRDGSVWARVEWTSKGQELIAARLYRRISPTWMHTKKGNVVTRILGAGLVNRPAIPSLKPLTASEQETTMKPEDIARALGIATDADEATILAAAEGLRENNERLGRIAAAAGADTAAEDAGEAAICAALKPSDPDPAKYVPMAAFTELQTTVAALRESDVERTAEQLVTAAKAEGKLTPAQEDWARTYAAKDPEGFKGWADKAPSIITAGRTISVAPPERKEGELAPQQSVIAAACGVSAEAFAKTEQTITAARDARGQTGA